MKDYGEMGEWNWDKKMSSKNSSKSEITTFIPSVENI